MSLFIKLCAALGLLIVMSCEPKSFAANKNKACSKEDIKVAINSKNHEFPQLIDKCASKAWGDEKKTTACLKNKYPKLSTNCATCFGKMADCSASNCKFKCIGNHFSDKCLDCVDKHCRGADKSSFSISDCTGLKAQELPPKK